MTEPTDADRQAAGEFLIANLRQMRRECARMEAESQESEREDAA